MPSPSLFFVPDISGFTDFVHRTEIEHSQHIISELLELIVNNNQLDLEISEVEGDAVLFFKQNDVPGIEDIYEQAKRMFLQFHAHLNLYERQRICQCGACSTASHLRLKFVIHSGEIGFTTIRKNKKPFGADIILIHKLLKNDIQQNEYILFTDQYISISHSQQLPTIYEKLCDGESKYENIGPVHYRYLSLSELYELVPEPPPIVLPDKMKNPIWKEHILDLSLMDANEYISNFEWKKK